MSVLETLTEGIRSRSLANEGEALLQKWEKTGLLEGLNDVARNNMSRLLENQAAQLLKESSLMGGTGTGGDVEGFSAVAFPIVRRVFGNLLAQDLVSVQPMSLPSGLIFFMDFTFESAMAAGGADAGGSLYGGGRVASQITGGVNLGGANAEKSFYGLNNGYSAATASANLAGDLAAGSNIPASKTLTEILALLEPSRTLALGRLQGDPDVFSTMTADSDSEVIEVKIAAADIETHLPGLNRDNLVAIDLNNTEAATGGTPIRRLARMEANGDISFIILNTDAGVAAAAAAGNTAATYNMADEFSAGGSIGSVDGGDRQWGLEAESNLKEIDVKVDSVAVTAMTRKLKAKWSPELAQDLNAYHNLDAEVELTSILSEQIALEIDREILNDLVNGATGGTLHWSRSPGKFVDRETGTMAAGTNYPDFTGTVSEWYETLLETVNDVSARIHRKTLRGGANFLVCSPEVASILEFTSGFRASTAVDSDTAGSWGAQNIGSISRKMDIHVDPYFPRALILVGRKGSSFLESGYVYAPYVPLQVTPTIFGVEDFVPRKGVMTRYAKKMVRPDMYGVVVVRDLVADLANV